ncbi:MAG: rod shape-determining protein MreC [Dialister sp.]|nr:rod shape-determining protein MreC [Dialister sp.]
MFFFGKRKILFAIALFLCMALCGWLWRHRESVPFVSQPLSIAAAPFEYGTSRLAASLKTGSGVLHGIITNWQELEGLKRENDGLRFEQAGYSEILSENIRLRNLLSFKQGYTQYSMLGASVIARDYGGWTQTMAIDRGSEDGISKYMPVIVPAGVVGFVSEVYKTSSKVQLIIDPRTNVGGIVQRPSSRLVSMVSGVSNVPGHVSFTNLSREADILKGDIIVTSGYGGVYPKGLVIGTVESIMPAGDSELSGKAIIKPSADFSHMEEVFVITSAIERTRPETIKNEVPFREPPMNPNRKQAGE